MGFTEEKNHKKGGRFAKTNSNKGGQSEAARERENSNRRPGKTRGVEMRIEGDLRSMRKRKSSRGGKTEEMKHQEFALEISRRGFCATGDKKKRGGRKKGCESPGWSKNKYDKVRQKLVEQDARAAGVVIERK